MKALSLTQPWSTLVVTGAKRFETRSWSTKYRGPLLIHAAKRFPAYAKDYALEVYRNAAVLPDFPLGAIVGRVYLLEVVHVEDLLALSIQEAKYGDYTPGRWVWQLAGAEMFETPIPYKGALGLFEVALPVGGIWSIPSPPCELTPYSHDDRGNPTTGADAQPDIH